MKLIKNIAYRSINLEGEVFFPLFERYIRFSTHNYEGNADLDLTYVNQCAAYLNSLSDDLINRLCQGSIMYCNYYLDEYLGEDQKEFINCRDVLSLITPLNLSIPKMKRNEPIVHLELDCEWEPEHGMEWIVRGDRVLYIGSFESEDPWDEFPERERYINGGKFENFAC